MPRVTISIPKELKERLDDPRVRKSINVSRVCQAALRREVHRVADLPPDLARMRELIDRLRKEKEKARDKWFVRGVELGRDWVEHEAPYARLGRLGRASQAERVRLLEHNPPPALQRQLRETRELSPNEAQSLLEGFAHVTGILWDVLEDKL